MIVSEPLSPQLLSFPFSYYLVSGPSVWLIVTLGTLITYEDPSGARGASALPPAATILPLLTLIPLALIPAGIPPLALAVLLPILLPIPLVSIVSVPVAPILCL
jgi:hypothetical protein